MTPAAPGFMTCLTSITTGLSTARTVHPLAETFQIQVTSTGYAEVRAAGRHVAMILCPEQVPDVMAYLSTVHGYVVTPLPETLWRRLCGLSGWEIVVPQTCLSRHLPARAIPLPKALHTHPGDSREGLGSVRLKPVRVTKTVGGQVLQDVPALHGTDGSLRFTRDVAAVLSDLSGAHPAQPPARVTRPLQPKSSPDCRVEALSTLRRLRAALVRWFG